MFAFEFQSAPLTEARGDPLASVPVARRIKVSIRSPYRSKGRLAIVSVNGRTA